MTRLAELFYSVQSNASVRDAVAHLLHDLANQFASINKNPIAVHELADTIKADADKWAEAVVVNTPGERVRVPPTAEELRAQAVHEGPMHTPVAVRAPVETHPLTGAPSKTPGGVPPRIP